MVLNVKIDAMIVNMGVIWPQLPAPDHKKKPPHPSRREGLVCQTKVFRLQA
jgi:hypothetical protein